MNKRTLSTGAAAFILSILFVVALCGFAVADNNMRTLGFGTHQPIFELQSDDESISLSFMGLKQTVQINTLNSTSFYAQRMSVLIPPRLRLGAQLLQGIAATRAED